LVLLTLFHSPISSITQCAVLPGQSFDYRFIAEPAGTHTWHAHHGVERPDGLFGALIVNSKNSSTKAKPRPSTQQELCGNDKPELLVLSVWQHEASEDVYIKRDGAGWFPWGPDKHPYQWTRDTSGKLVGEIPFKSALINGRGRFGNESELALTEFKMAPSSHKCFRMIASQEGKALRVSIDQHLLTAFASDGMDFTPVDVESIIVFPGKCMSASECIDVQLLLTLLASPFQVKLSTSRSPAPRSTMRSTAAHRLGDFGFAQRRWRLLVAILPRMEGTISRTSQCTQPMLS
jgi:hypothetical protein